jgi:hypothetical protein
MTKNTQIQSSRGTYIFKIEYEWLEREELGVSGILFNNGGVFIVSFVLKPAN